MRPPAASIYHSPHVPGLRPMSPWCQLGRGCIIATVRGQGQPQAEDPWAVDDLGKLLSPSPTPHLPLPAGLAGVKSGG